MLLNNEEECILMYIATWMNVNSTMLNEKQWYMNTHALTQPYLKNITLTEVWKWLPVEGGKFPRMKYEWKL